MFTTIGRIEALQSYNAQVEAIQNKIAFTPINFYWYGGILRAAKCVSGVHTWKSTGGWIDF